MAAFTAVLLAAKSRGTHVVGIRPIYGTADHLLSSGLLGLTVTWVKQDEVAAAIRPDTGAPAAAAPLHTDEMFAPLGTSSR